MGRRAGDVLAGLIMVVIGAIIIYVAFYLYTSTRIQGLLEATIPDNAVISVEWSGVRYSGSSSAATLGLGEYKLTRPLCIVSINNTIYCLEPGVTLAVALSLVKPMPFLLLIAFLLNYTGVWLIVKATTGRELPFPGLKYLSIALLLAILFSILIPVPIDVGPGDTVYLKIDKASRKNNTLVVVTEGMLLTSGRLLADHVMRMLASLVVAGIGVMILGIGLFIALVEPKQTIQHRQ